MNNIEVGEIDEEGSKDMEAVAEMIELAEDNDLLAEVVLHFGLLMKSSDSIQAACSAALYEWDI